MSNNILASGSAAIFLKPEGDVQGAFEADLSLEHCTLASEDRFLELGRWAGIPSGPQRPWLVTTQKCAFFANYQRPTQNSVLVHADPDSFTHGVLFWQATGDTFQVPHFLSTGKSHLSEANRADVARDWTNLWGASHIRAVTGPLAPDGTMSARTVVRLRPSLLEPGDLAIDPTYRVEPAPPRDVGADFARLGITPSQRVGRRR